MGHSVKCKAQSSKYFDYFRGHPPRNFELWTLNFKPYRFSSCKLILSEVEVLLQGPLQVDSTGPICYVLDDFRKNRIMSDKLAFILE
jgi:hypothetical protein